jgi:transposase
MRRNLVWLSDERWAKIKPLIPMNRSGPKAHNNQRFLSGIIDVPTIGLSTGIRPAYGGIQPL